jgi:hypothetical protein
MEELGSFLTEYVPVAQSALNHPSVRYVVDDGRRYLYANPDENFDMIFIDPLWSFTAGHNNLYSQEAIKLYQSHLSEDGIFCAWVNESHFIPKTVATIFPYSDSFGDYLVNGNQPIAYDADYMHLVYNNYLDTQSTYLDPSARETMNPDAILSHQKQGQAKTLQMEQNVPVLTDLTPWLEYYYVCPPRLLESLQPQQLRYCYGQFIR